MIGKTNIPMGMSKGETVSILLKTNQSSNEDLNGVKVVISYDDESHEYTYNGQFSVEIPKDKTYTVAFSEVDGYKTPSSVTYTAVKGFSRSVEAMYYSEFLTINVTNAISGINDFELTIFKQETVGVTTKYTRLEYIEATGTQYIDTGFIPTINTTVFANLLIPSGAGNKNLFCAYTNFALNSMSDEKLEYRVGTGNWTQIATPSTVTSRFDVEFSCKEIKFNGTTIASPNLSSLSNTYTLWLFSRSGGSSTYYGHARIYSLKIYDNDILVRDYIPALRSDGIAGLYDAVNDVFYSSRGTTEFEYGTIEDTVIATQTSNSKLHKIAYDTKYRIEASDVSGFTTPESQTYTASQPTRTISMEYTKASEHVIVNVVDENDAFANGQTLTVSGDITESYTIMNSKVEFDVPEGLTYTVSVNDKDGYITPDSQTFTAGIGTREIDMVYEEVKLGVFIQGVSGKLYETDAWTSQETPNGVAVLTEECSFVIALTEASRKMSITSYESEALEKYITRKSNETDAKADYDGAANTTNIMKLRSSTSYAAGWCNSFSFPSGKNGFLPSLGQMWAAYSNKAAVDEALIKAGGTGFDLLNEYWTSTFCGVRLKTYRINWVLCWDEDNVNTVNTTYQRLVRAFCSL